MSKKFWSGVDRAKKGKPANSILEELFDSRSNNDKRAAGAKWYKGQKQKKK